MTDVTEILLQIEQGDESAAEGCYDFSAEEIRLRRIPEEKDAVMRTTRFTTVVGLLLLLGCGRSVAAELSDANFAEVQKLVKPQPGESLWQHIPWETSLSVARSKAAAEGKPLLIWAGGGAAPLGGC